jgi:DNA-binding NtrC family response regulator
MISYRLQGKRVLIVDDEPDLREVISARFEMEGCEVALAENGQVALDALKRKNFDAVISDIRMPGGNGLELLELIGQFNPIPAVILISGFSDVEPEEVLARGASALLVKPFDLDDVINAVCDALESKSSSKGTKK